MKRGAIFGLFLLSFVLIWSFGVNGQTECVDSDNGQITSIKGETTGPSRCIINGVTQDCPEGIETEIDRCVQGSYNVETYGLKPQLNEYFCGDDRRITVIGNLCQYGCYDGRCLNKNEIKVDLKVNGQDSPKSVTYMSKMDVSWEIFGNARICDSSGTHIPLFDKSGLWANIEKTIPRGNTELLAAFAYNGDLNQIQYLGGLTLGITCENNLGEQITDRINIEVLENIQALCTDLEGTCRISKCLSGEKETIGKCDFSNDLCCVKNEFGEDNKCTDSDNGEDYYNKGLSKKNDTEINDGCIVGGEHDGWLREAICQDNSATWIDYKCPNGCSEGKCIGGESEDIGYIIQSDFGSIKFQSIEEGATADTIDAILLWFSNFVDGAFARYSVGEPTENKDLSVSVAEFEGSISFAEFEEKYVKLLKENSQNTVLDYDGAIEGENNALMLSAETISTLRDGSKKTEVGISWVSEDKFILVNVGDKDSVWTENEDGGISTSRDFLKFLSAYQHKFPSTLVPPRGQIPKEKRDDLCNFGCKIENNCVPVGYRTSDEYCGLEGNLILQLQAETSCNNNFECESNVCVSGQCVETGLIQKILEWFRKLFGRE